LQLRNHLVTRPFENDFELKVTIKTPEKITDSLLRKPLKVLTS